MMQIQDYIKVYKEWIDPKICKSILSQIDNADWQQHVFYTDNGDYVNVSGDRELDISYPNIAEHDYLLKRIWDVAYQYIAVDFKSDVFQGWGGYSYPRFNRYKEDRLMAKHCDHIHDLFEGKRKGIPILSLVGALNDDYEGGEIEFPRFNLKYKPKANELLLFPSGYEGGEFVMFDDYVIELKQGDVLMFPSVFLYPHRVNPVTKGVRDTFVSWVW